MADFRIESDVREAVREAFPRAQWIEAALGGSTGLPDCFINDEVEGSKVAFFELKIGELFGNELRYHVRPAQRKRIKKMLKAGYAVWLLVGEVRTNRCWRIRPSPGTLGGSALVIGEGEFNDGVPILDLGAKLMEGSLQAMGFPWD